MVSRAIAPVVALAVLFGSAGANAQTPGASPAPGYAPPGYAPPPGYGYPPGYAPQPYGAQPGYGAPRPSGYGYPAPPGYYPPGEGLGPVVPMKRRSPTMIALGSTLVSIGTTLLIAGPALIAGSSQGGVSCDEFGNCSQSSDSTAKSTGIGLVVVGVLAMGGGIPLIIIGAQKVPERGDEAKVHPTLRVGAGTAKVGFDF